MNEMKLNLKNNKRLEEKLCLLVSGCGGWKGDTPRSGAESALPPPPPPPEPEDKVVKDGI